MVRAQAPGTPAASPPGTGASVVCNTVGPFARYGPEVVEACDVVCTIPQAPGAESLNAAQAATLALYEAVRQRSAQAASENGG